METPCIGDGVTSMAFRALVLATVSIGTMSCVEAPEPIPNVQLTIATDTQSIPVDQPLIVAITLRNNGHLPVSLVKPGEGSDQGWRTPTLDWVIGKADDPTASPRILSRLCGNTSPIRPGDVFTLNPGEQKQFTRSIRQIPFDPALGTYNLTLIYANDPQKQVPLSGVVLNEFEQLTLDQVRESTLLSVTSNTIHVAVTDSVAQN